MRNFLKPLFFFLRMKPADIYLFADKECGFSAMGPWCGKLISPLSGSLPDTSQVMFEGNLTIQFFP